MVATLNFWVWMNWASSGAMVTGWNLAPEPSTAISRLDWWACFQRALSASASVWTMRWSLVRTPLGMAASPNSRAPYFSAPRPKPMASRA